MKKYVFFLMSTTILCTSSSLWAACDHDKNFPQGTPVKVSTQAKKASPSAWAAPLEEPKEKTSGSAQRLTAAAQILSTLMAKIDENVGRAPHPISVSELEQRPKTAPGNRFAVAQDEWCVEEFCAEEE